MGFGLIKEHHSFFHKHRFIEFEDLLPSKKIDRLKELTLASIPPQKWIEKGHDLWRQNKEIEPITLHRGLAEIASNLCKKKPLRIAYDQLIRAPLTTVPLTLIKASAMRKVICGCIIQLSSDTPLSENPLIPKKQGNGIFFSPLCQLDFPQGCHLLLIVYTERSSQYVYEMDAPNLHFLKNLGYVFGDALRSDTHPLLL